MEKEPRTEAVEITVIMKGLEHGVETYENRQDVIVRLFSSVPCVFIKIKDYYNSNCRMDAYFAHAGEGEISYDSLHFGKGLHALMVQAKTLSGETARDAAVFKVLSGDIEYGSSSEISKDSTITTTELDYIDSPVTSFRVYVPEIPNHSGTDYLTVYGRKTENGEYEIICRIKCISGGYIESDKDGNQWWGYRPDARYKGWPDQYDRTGFDPSSWNQLKASYEVEESHMHCMEYANEAMQFDIIRAADNSGTAETKEYYMERFTGDYWR